MKMMIIGFLLGVALCIFTGAEIYRPVRGIITRTETQNYNAKDIQSLMRNQESIFNLIMTRCGEK